MKNFKFGKNKLEKFENLEKKNGEKFQILKKKSTSKCPKRKKKNLWLQSVLNGKIYIYRWKAEFLFGRTDIANSDNWVSVRVRLTPLNVTRTTAERKQNLNIWNGKFPIKNWFTAVEFRLKLKINHFILS